MLTSQLKQGLGQDAAELTQRLIKHKTESAAEIIRWKKASTIVSEQLTKSNERVLDLEYQLDAARQDDSSVVDELQEQLLEEQEKRREDQARIVQLEDALHEARRNEHSDESFEQMEVRLASTSLSLHDCQLTEGFLCSKGRGGSRSHSSDEVGGGQQTTSGASRGPAA
jgi:flagellar biosynthesis GTPase FlhF